MGRLLKDEDVSHKDFGIKCTVCQKGCSSVSLQIRPPSLKIPTDGTVPYGGLQVEFPRIAQGGCREQHPPRSASIKLNTIRPIVVRQTDLQFFSKVAKTTICEVFLSFLGIIF